MSKPQTTILFDIWLLSRATAGLLDEALADSGLSGDDFGLYSLLRGFGPATPGEISQWSGMRQNTVSAALKRIEERGDLQRKRNPTDGRSSVVSLSPSGQRRHTDAARRFRSVMADVLAELPDSATSRVALQQIDHVIRVTAGLPPRPYRLPEADGGWTLSFTGDPLTSAQQSQVHEYVRWLQSQ